MVTIYRNSAVVTRRQLAISAIISKPGFLTFKSLLFYVAQGHCYGNHGNGIFVSSKNQLPWLPSSNTH